METQAQEAGGYRHPWHKKYTLRQIRINLLQMSQKELSRKANVDERSIFKGELLDQPAISELTMAKILRGVNPILQERGLLKDKEGNTLSPLMVENIAGFEPYEALKDRPNRGGRPKGARGKKKLVAEDSGDYNKS